MGESAKRFTNVFIKNLDEDVDKEKLEKMFSEFGTVRYKYFIFEYFRIISMSFASQLFIPFRSLPAPS